MRILTPPASTGTNGSQCRSLCLHTPACPTSDSPDAEAARVVAGHPEQGWSPLCNGLVVFDDTGDLLPDGQAVAPHRPAATAV